MFIEKQHLKLTIRKGVGGGGEFLLLTFLLYEFFRPVHKFFWVFFLVSCVNLFYLIFPCTTIFLYFVCSPISFLIARH